MKAILFAAGLGTRLHPLTDYCPKALVQLNGIPLIGHALRQLKTWGVGEVIVNVHHFPDQIITWLDKNEKDLNISISDERDQLLDTGGGLLKAYSFFQDEAPFIACNVDVLTSLDLAEAIHFHNDQKALATLIVRDRPTTRYFLFDDTLQLTGWTNLQTGEKTKARTSFDQSSPLAFSGIQILSPSIFDLITERGKFSITSLYLRLARDYPILGYYDRSEFWIDLGKPDQINEAENWLKSHPL